MQLWSVKLIVKRQNLSIKHSSRIPTMLESNRIRNTTSSFHSHGDHHHSHGDHHHSHGDHHHSHGDKEDDAFRRTVAFNCGLSGLQLLIGAIFGSLALMGDAVHNIGDVIGLLLGWGAEILSNRDPTQRFTYGFYRSTQLASLVNGILIFSGAAVIVLEAIFRLGEPVELTSIPVACASAIGMVVNLLSARMFGNTHQHDLNRRAVVIHLLGDAAVSMVVLLSTFIVALTGWDWLDPTAAIVVGTFVAWSGWKVLKAAIFGLFDNVPSEINIKHIESLLLGITGIQSIHELRIWELGGSKTALTVHLVRDLTIAKNEFNNDNSLICYAQKLLDREGISYTTLQLELDPCYLAYTPTRD
uniref:Cation efflux family protein n=1 Tax=Paulinella longichromatophora TaxID=1708747 RepID=A0A2H4ZNF0_9EUKA|nr:cation efflux family protein [Paulinella longichromatophora]